MKAMRYENRIRDLIRKEKAAGRPVAISRMCRMIGIPCGGDTHKWVAKLVDDEGAFRMKKFKQDWKEKELQPPQPKPIRNWPCHRAKLACKIGRDALDASIPDLPDGVTAEQWALYNLLHAVEDIANAIENLEVKSK